MVRSRTSPAPGVGTSASSIRKSDGFGSPTGREARTTRLADCDMVVPSSLASGECRTTSSLGPTRIVRAFTGDGDVVDVAFAQARAGDAHELRLFMELGQIASADITHCRAKTSGELMHDVGD